MRGRITVRPWVGRGLSSLIEESVIESLILREEVFEEGGEISSVVRAV